MSTATLNNLLEYLYGTLSRNDMRWVADHLIERIRQEEDSERKPYTMDEVNAMLEVAEADFAAGQGVPDEEVWRELEEEFAQEDARHAASLWAA